MFSMDTVCLTRTRKDNSVNTCTHPIIFDKSKTSLENPTWIAGWTQADQSSEGSRKEMSIFAVIKNPVSDLKSALLMCYLFLN